MQKSEKAKLTTGKRWLFRFLALCFSLVVMELTCSLLWTFLAPDETWEEVRRQQRHLRQRAGTAADSTEAIHPYLGWVFDPKAMKDAHEASGKSLSVNSLGLVDDAPTIVKRNPNTVLIGICGGSVAQDLSWMSFATLSQRFAEMPEFQGRQIRFVRLAMAGYKQPQQLMALNYLLALGGELDVLINVDGFNEMVLAVDENYRGDVFMAYPRHWHHRLQDVVDPQTFSVSYRLLGSRARRQSAASMMVNSWLQNSRTANFLWILYDQWLWREQLALGRQLWIFQDTHGRTFARSGPANMQPNRDTAIAGAIDLWVNCSRQLHHLCKANKIRYLHVLQPNQYHANSKPLSAEERNKFYAPDELFATLVHDAYPQAIIAGDALRKEGVQFCNLTQVFASEKDTIYRDYFCHYNQKGSDLLAEAVADALQTSFATP